MLKLHHFYKIEDSAIATWQLDNGLYIKGETYPIKEHLKEIGFNWDADNKQWKMSVKNTAEARRAWAKLRKLGHQIVAHTNYGDFYNVVSKEIADKPMWTHDYRSILHLNLLQQIIWDAVLAGIVRPSDLVKLSDRTRRWTDVQREINVQALEILIDEDAHDWKEIDKLTKEVHSLIVMPNANVNGLEPGLSTS